MQNQKFFGVLVAAGIGLLSSVAGAQVQQLVVDFEGYPEGTEISDQYAKLGLTFSIDGKPDLLPIFGTRGNPRVGFSGGNSDGPLASGDGFMADPVIGNDELEPNNIAIDIDPPAVSLRIFVHDIEDPEENTTIRAFYKGVEVDSMTIEDGDPGTGNGSILPLSVEAAAIDRVVLEVVGPDTVGIGFDFLTINRNCVTSACGGAFEISQESAPGAGDFDDNIMGYTLPYETNGTAAEFYAYNVPQGDSWNGPNLVPEADRSHLLLSRGPEGVGVFIVHDRAVPDDPDGGEAEVVFELVDDPDGAMRAVEDDPENNEGGIAYVGEPGDSLFMSSHGWNTCCSDGVAYTEIDIGSTGYLSFSDVNNTNDTIVGLSEWYVYSAGGDEFPLVLEEDRRVRIVFIPTGCPGDVNDDGLINLADLNIVLANFGTAGEIGDATGDGLVNLADLNMVLANFGGACE
ncbi:MAG: hypothetical protein ACF8MJ_01125 [Phycisphaerales bacterium JB050]